MKKKVVKELRGIANKLPDSYVIESKRVVKQGKDFDLDHRRKLKLADDQMYTFNKKEEVFVKINHLSKLKAAYKKGGMSEVEKYIDWLNKHNYKMDLLATELSKRDKQRKAESNLTLKQYLVNESRLVLLNFKELLTAPFKKLTSIKWVR